MRTLIYVPCTGCTSTVSTIWGPIAHGVQNHRILGWKRSNRFKVGVYVEGSCHYWFVLFVNLNFIRYGDTAVQSKCIWISNVQESQYFIFGANRAGKYVLTLHTKLYLGDGRVKFNGQNDSIVTGPLYVHTNFEAIWTRMWWFWTTWGIGPHIVGTTQKCRA